MGAQSSASPRPPGPILLRTKLSPPPVRAGLVPRARLDGLLETGAKGRLCLVDAPAGSGKTTLLAQWWRADHGARRVAWLSLDDGDDDPVRFWSYVVEAFRVVEPGFGEGALALLQGPGTADILTQMILPELLNELTTCESDLVLVLDDYHLVTNGVCHASLGFFVEHLPANVHLMLASRVDPPLPLARLRASGELVELRIAELGFTSAEADQLLGEAMGLELTADQTERLWERTEGWAAGLYLAGLSLRGQRDPGPFIASFEAGHRHIVDYLGAEVLARQPEPLRSFMVRTSVLERLSGPLCDAVLETEGSAELLAELEQANLFLIALDDHRHWYRYHHLFAQLLRLELAGRDADLVPLLHRRAAAWHQAAGDVEAAVHHAIAAGDHQRATDLVTHHWLSFARQGTGRDRGALAGRAARRGRGRRAVGGGGEGLDRRVPRLPQGGDGALAGHRRPRRPRGADSRLGRIGPVRGRPGPRPLHLRRRRRGPGGRPPGRRARRPGTVRVGLDGHGGARAEPVSGRAAGRGPGGAGHGLPRPPPRRAAALCRGQHPRGGLAARRGAGSRRHRDDARPAGDGGRQGRRGQLQPPERDRRHRPGRGPRPPG